MTTVYFATNRNVDGTRFRGRFHRDGPHFYRVGWAEVTWNKQAADGTVEDWDDYAIAWEVQPERRPQEPEMPDIPEMHQKEARGERPGSFKIFEDLRRKMRQDGRDAIIFIHGFANDFENSVARAAQLAEEYLVPSRSDPGGALGKPHVFVFSWPSDGKVHPPWKYASDRDDAQHSGIAMARALRRFYDFLHEGERCPGRIHLVAHSMGNWALRHALLGLWALVEGRGGTARLFENALLMAADEDADCFEHDHKLRRLTALARSIHVYHSHNDLALVVSDTTKFNPNRLGGDGPRNSEVIGDNIVSVDCSRVDFTEISHGRHQYYRLRREVIADVRAVLSGRFPSDEIPDRKALDPGRRYRITTENPSPPPTQQEMPTVGGGGR